MQFVANERLLLEQGYREPVERGSVLLDQALRLLVGVVGETGLLGVAKSLRLLGERLIVRPHCPRRCDIGHAVLEDH